MRPHELLLGKQCFLFVVVVAILLLVPLPHCAIPGKPSLHSDVSFVLPHAIICLNHRSDHHAGHLNISGPRSTGRVRCTEAPVPRNSHFELDGQASVDGRREISEATQQAGKSTPFDSAVDGTSCRLPGGSRDLLISHGIVGPHSGS